MPPLTAAIKRSGGANSPQKYRSDKEESRHKELIKPILTPQQVIVTVNENIVYEPTYLILIDGIPVTSYTPDFAYDEEIYKVEGIGDQESLDQFCLDSCKTKARISSRRVAEDVKGRIIEAHSILKMQMLVALNRFIYEGRIVLVTGSKESRIYRRFTKDQFRVEPKPNSLTQVANSSKSESQRIFEIKQILSRYRPFLSVKALRSILEAQERGRRREEEEEELDLATLVKESRLGSLNPSEELWVNALQKAQEDGEILNFWVKPIIYPDLGDVRIFLEPYVPTCIYETKRGELVLIDVYNDEITKKDWIMFNVTKILLKDVIEIFKTYAGTILLEEWSRDLHRKIGIVPKETPEVDPYEDLDRVCFWDLVK